MRIHSRILFLIVALSWGLSLRSAVRANDWPQWRGPDRDGVCNETGLLHTFPADGLKIRWRAPVGWGWSSPVVARGRVFVTDAELLKSPLARERVQCFEETSGKLLWTFSYEVTYSKWAFTPGQENGPCPTPIVEADRIYMLGANGHVHCLDAQNGALVWEKNIGTQYEVPEMQCRGSPLIERNLLILFTGAKPDASLVALDKTTGKEVWRKLNESVSNSSPIVISAGGERQLIVWTGESVTSLNPATGETWWREPMVTSNNDAIPTPVAQKERLLVGGLMLELNKDTPIAKVLWPASKAVSKRILSNTSTALLFRGHVYSAKSSGELVCLNEDTGELVWQTNRVTEVRNGASIHLTPNGDAVFLFTDQGNLIRAELTAEGYREISRARLIEPTTPFGGRKCAWTAPAYANGHVYARSEKELVCASLAANP